MKIPMPEARKARIEIIPMIDAIFFLLVFFMFSSLSMVKMKGVGVALPTSNAQAAPPSGTRGATGGGGNVGANQAKLIVTVDERGRYFVNKNGSSAGNLATDLGRGLAKQPGAIVIVNVAPTQSTQQLIAVMDAIGTLPQSKDKPLQVLIASEKVDANGAAVKSQSKP